MSECRRCAERGQTWAGDAPKCGFPQGVFDASNWNCATLNDLRELAEDLGVRQREDDQSAALIPCDPGNGNWPYVVLEWYKNRGRTDAAWELNGETAPAPLTLETAETILRLAPDYFSHRLAL